MKQYMYKNFIILLFSIFSYACVATGTFQKNYHKRKINNYITSLIENNNLNMTLGIKVISLEDGKSLYELNAEKLLIPASNIKLLTSAASLYYLGPNHIFSTMVLKKNNNLALIGSADPGLSVKRLDSLANIVSRQMEKIDTLFLDNGILDSIHFGKGWMWDEGSEEFSAAISGLTLNNNCIDFQYSPGELSQPAAITIFPNTSFISFENNSLTVMDTVEYKKFNIERNWINQTNHFNISGEILINSEKDTIKKNIFNPTLFTGTVFKELLESYGTTVEEIEIRHRINFKDTIAINYSKSLDQYLKSMMQKSENLTAELFIKSMGISDTSIGNWNNGVLAVKKFLYDQANIDTSLFRLADGSGLSRYNLINANQVVQLLAYMNDSKWQNTFINTLPYGNEKNTRLEGRLMESGNKLFAKTGSISGVSCLSGYAYSNNYGPIAFSILINGFVGSIQPYRKFQDDICNYLVKN